MIKRIIRNERRLCDIARGITRKEERLTAVQNICAATAIIGITLFAGAGNELTAVIAIALIILGSIGVSVCDNKLKKEKSNEKI